MAELREAHLRYLLAVFELGKDNPDVGIQDVAKALNCSKASVTKMMGTLMDMGLLVREKYGKIYLTDTGFLLAKDLLRCVETIQVRFPALGLELTAEETQELIYIMVVNLPEHCRNRLAGRDKTAQNEAVNDKEPMDRIAPAFSRDLSWGRMCVLP